MACFLRSKTTRSRKNHRSVIDRFAHAGKVCENWKRLPFGFSWAAKQGDQWSTHPLTAVNQRLRATEV